MSPKQEIQQLREELDLTRKILQDLSHERFGFDVSEVGAVGE